MADEYIRREDTVDALADYIKNIDKVYSTGKLTQDECIDCAESVLDDLFSADVTPVVHGKWISECEPHYECSECHHWFHLYQYMNYCPNCGAKMDGG